MRIKPKLTRKILILGLSLIVVVIGISILNIYSNKVAGITNPPLLGKFCDNPTIQALICGKFVAWDKTTLAAGGPYQTVSGNVDISGDVSATGKVSIGTTTPIGLLTMYNAGTFNPSSVGLKQLVFGDILAPTGWRGTGFCTGNSTSGTNSCFAGNLNNWYWGTQVDPNTIRTTMRLEPSGNGSLYVYGKGYQPGGGNWGDSSDIRLKKNIRPITNALDKILKLQGVNFEWINPEEHGSTGGIQGGFIAQDIEKIFPNWISTIEASGKDKSLIPSDEKIKGLALPFEYDALLVEAVKEQQAQIKNLQTENLSLKSQLHELDLRLKALETKLQ